MYRRGRPLEKRKRAASVNGAEDTDAENATGAADAGDTGLAATLAQARTLAPTAQSLELF